jgi:hypothetical protein
MGKQDETKRDHTFFTGFSSFFSTTSFLAFFSSEGAAAAGAGAAAPSTVLIFLASFFFWFFDKVEDMESSAPPADLARDAATSSSSAARFLGLLVIATGGARMRERREWREAEDRVRVPAWVGGLESIGSRGGEIVVQVGRGGLKENLRTGAKGEFDAGLMSDLCVEDEGRGRSRKIDVRE